MTKSCTHAADDTFVQCQVFRLIQSLQTDNEPERNRVSRVGQNAIRAVLAVVLLTGVADFLPTAWSQESPAEAESVTLAPFESVGSAIEQLSAAEYSQRQAAYAYLKQRPEEAVPELRQRLIDHDLPVESISSALRLLSEWAADPLGGPTQDVLQTIEAVAESRQLESAAPATRLLRSLATDFASTAIEHLEGLGANIGVEQVQVMTSASPHYTIRIDEGFRGQDKDLLQMRWLSDVDVVKLQGREIGEHAIQAVARMPRVRILQLRNVRLDKQQLQLLCDNSDLETLELLYCQIDAAALPLLRLLPVSGNLRLFGTDLPPAEIAALEEELKGVHIVSGKGGFLGVQISPPSSTRIEAVTAGGAAEQAGLLPGDVLTHIGDAQLEDFESLRVQLANFAPGESVTLKWLRPTQVTPNKWESVEMSGQTTLQRQPLNAG